MGIRRVSILGAIAVALVVSSCAPGAEPQSTEAWWQPDEGATEQAAGVSCVAGNACSGSDPVYTSMLRVGWTATARSVLAQTFVAGSGGRPASVTLVARSLRRFSNAGDPQLRVEIVEPLSATAPDLRGVPVLASGATSIAALPSGPVRIALGGSGTLVAGRTYALSISTEAAPSAAELVLVGIGAFATSTYAIGDAFLAGERRATVLDTFAPARLRPASFDLAFALSGAAGSPCVVHADCSSALRCVANACAASSPTPPQISPATATLAPGYTTTFAVSGGTGPYVFSVASGLGSLTGADYTAGASAGTATVRVTDAFGSTSDAGITVNEALAIAPASVTVGVSGTASFSATGGVPPYEFSLASGVGTVSAASYLAPSSPGAAVVRVTDAFSRTADASVTIANLSAVLDPANRTAGVVLSADGLTASNLSAGAHVLATVGKSTGKWYWEITYVSATGGGGLPIDCYLGMGITTSFANIAADAAWGYRSYWGGGAACGNYAVRPGGGTIFAGAGVTLNGTVGLRLDMDAGSLWVSVNGGPPVLVTSSLAGTFFPFLGNGGYIRAITATANFGGDLTNKPFKYAVPAGFNAGVF